jgi:hypothetical protein
LWSPDILTILKRNGVLMGVVAGVRGAGRNTKKVWVEVCLIIGRDDRGFIKRLMQE